MLLQLAIDRPESFSVIPLVSDLVDIIEVGTPTLKRLGLAAISTVRELAPEVPVLADTKTIDGGEQEADMVFNAGAMFMSVLTCAPPATVRATSTVAARYGAYIVLDAIAGGFAEPAMATGLAQRCAYVVSHSSVDARTEGAAPVADHIAQVSQFHQLGYRVALAGGISKRNLSAAVEAAPDVLVIGRAVTNARNPRRAVEWILERVPDRGHGWPWEPK